MAFVETDVSVMQEKSNFTSLIIGNWKRNGSKALRNTPSVAMFTKLAWKFGVTHMRHAWGICEACTLASRAPFPEATC